jgi:hypothetical protein
VADYRRLRRRAPQNSRQIGGTKWNRTQAKILSQLIVHVPAACPFATGLMPGQDSEEFAEPCGAEL